ncbi:MAG: aminotransferase class I/II-fold pyridoxal phosphate-dependent enzyme [Eubacteriales bacterium]|nr:aminotransferase class I/II-fold pyridoxal phosphate-dependent enzyme [Eubacteriales bacterium]
MQAIILAAGMGKRLKKLTENMSKCMVPVNGITLIERMLLQLDRLSLDRIIIVIGYKADILTTFLSTLHIKTPVLFVRNEIYFKTNNIYSLYLASDYLLHDDTILLESDLIMTDEVLHKLIMCQDPDLAVVSKYQSWMDGTVVTLDADRNIIDFISKKKFCYEDIDQYFKTVNIYRFSKVFSASHYVPFLAAYIKSQGSSAYYEQVLNVIGRLDQVNIKAIVLDREVWYEIDDTQDLDVAESLFPLSAENNLSTIQARFGGYWRYPQLIDFCYLVNPYFPPVKMVKEIMANLEMLIRNYPSGMDVNCFVAAKCLGLNNDFICVGNGAAELIRSLMTYLHGRVGVIYPTFEEYPNRIGHDRIIPLYSGNQEFSYSAEDLMRYYDSLEISSLLLINPDNPSGNLVGTDEVVRLAKWAMGKGIRLIVDESFIDFSASLKARSLLSDEILADNKNLVVVKSISKSYGVPGLRLGVICSSDEPLIQYIKKDVSIWNINSIAEFYMQICEKYYDDYRQAIERFVKTRDEFIRDLKRIRNLKIFPTQANFVLCEVLNDFTATELTEKLLFSFKILIKDLSGKAGINGQFVRISIKSQEENQILMIALKKILESDEPQT